jgi:tetratricopeptide (TPR) repeat protein
LALAGGQREEGRQLCERSLRLEPYEPEHYLNLGRLHFAAGDSTAALAAFELGLAAAGDHPDLLAARNGLDRRALPPVPSLPRDHLLNRCLGKALSVAGVRRPGD